MNKPVKYVLGLALLGVVAYNSVYIKSLSEVKAAGTVGADSFNVDRFVQTFWTTRLLPTAPTIAVDLTILLSLLKTDQQKAFTTYSHALGIGNIRYFLVNGEGAVSRVGENDVAVALPSGKRVYLATEYIFGNAARDASGLLKLTDFGNTADLNSVSAALNDIIRRQVVFPLKAVAKPGRNLRFVGALELNQAHLHLDTLTLIPLIIR